uniref:BRX domain-containing protein n=1 Tax=Brassica campestris TaxID=3711 RepID=A0A3P5YTI6_BRACM|nr:unnamed protein product [Brassica rapa]
MLTCIACTKQLNTTNNGGSRPQQEEDEETQTPRTKHATKSLTSQLKDMAVKASGAYKSCKPCSGTSNRNQNRNYADSDADLDSGRFHYAYQRAGAGTGASTPKVWGKEMESRLKGLSSEEGTPTSMSGRTESIVFVEEDEAKEWVAQVEPGVLITFVSLPQGGNDLKRIRFRTGPPYGDYRFEFWLVMSGLAPQDFREMFDKWQAQRWWTENSEKVMELYNVKQFNQESEPLPTPPASEDGGSQIQSAKDSPVTPPMNNEQPRGMGYSSSDSLDHQPIQTPKRYDSAGLASATKLISGTKTEASSIDGGSARSSSADEGSEEVSVSNASDTESEWVEQDEPGIYITIRALPDGSRELKRVRFSRDKFGETLARVWWEQNRARIQKQYL